MYISNQTAVSGCSAGLGCSQGVGALTMDGSGLFGTGIFGTGVTLTDFSTWGAGEIGAVAAFLFLLYAVTSTTQRGAKSATKTYRRLRRNAA
jgi:hypothetical protein